jgi:hypothetical protein
MKKSGMWVVKLGLFAALSVIPMAAQILNGINFTAPFPFDAGNARMPAGSYKITQTDVDNNVLLLESRDGVHSVFLECIPAGSDQPRTESDVVFHKYGDTDYLAVIWRDGSTEGFKVLPTKAELKAAATTSAAEHTLLASKQ